MKKAYIYGLIDPIDGYLKYIGKTEIDLKQRLCHHLVEAKRKKRKNLKNAWLFGLLKKDIKPKLIILEETTSEMVNDLEIFYIAYMRFIGCPLKNQQPGGNGQPKGYQFKRRYIPPKGVVPKQFENYLYGWNKGMKLPKEWVEKAVASRKRNGVKHHIVPIISTNLETKEEVYFESQKLASETLNITPQLINNVLNNRLKSTKGYTFRYKDEFPREIIYKRPRKIEIMRYNNDETIIYVSVIDAYRKTGLARSSIMRLIGNNNKDYQGYKWKKIKN